MESERTVKNGWRIARYVIKTVIAASFPIAALVLSFMSDYPYQYIQWVEAFAVPYLVGVPLMPFLSIPCLIALLFVHRPRSGWDYAAIILYFLSIVANFFVLVYWDRQWTYLPPGHIEWPHEPIRRGCPRSHERLLPRGRCPLLCFL